MKRVLAMIFVGVLTATAAHAQPAAVVDAARTADRVVVAVVEDVTSRFAQNEFGDRLIVSDVWLRTEETLKGSHQNLVAIEIEGGTVGDLTLRVSDLPALQKGERGVFLLDARGGKNRPHGRGKGILKLDPADRIVGSELRLSDLKGRLKGQQK